MPEKHWLLWLGDSPALGWIIFCKAWMMFCVSPPAK
jgi:hypothetical protein